MGNQSKTISSVHDRTTALKNSRASLSAQGLYMTEPVNILPWDKRGSLAPSPICGGVDS